MMLTAASVLRVRRPRVFAALAVSMLLLGSCDPGAGEIRAEGTAPPGETAGTAVAAEPPAESGNGTRDGRGSEAAAPSRDGRDSAAEAPPAIAVPAVVPSPAESAAAVPAVVPSPPPRRREVASAPSPPPRPSPVADAPPPTPRAEPALSPEEAIEQACRPPVGAEVRSLVACGDVAEAYRRLMEENRSCSSDADCRVIEGSCAIGLGGCWYAVHRSVGYDDVDRLTARYRELACTGPVCRCAAPPERAVCDEGVCAAGS